MVFRGPVFQSTMVNFKSTVVNFKSTVVDAFFGPCISGGFHCSQRSLFFERCHQMMRPTRMRAMGGMIIRPLFS